MTTALGIHWHRGKEADPNLSKTVNKTGVTLGWTVKSSIKNKYRDEWIRHPTL